MNDEHDDGYNGRTTTQAARGESTMTGTIKSINKDKNYGFIVGENDEEYFFHASAVKNAEFRTLGVGQEVTFEDSEGEKGPRAEDVFI